MGSPATKLAAETELAETTTEPTGASGRSVDWTLPTADTGASPMAASSAPRPAENTILLCNGVDREVDNWYTRY